MRLFDRKSLSHQLFLSILTITAFVLTVLFSVSLHLLQESYQREERASVLDKLSKCSRITDLSLEYMGQDSRMLSTNASLISAVVAPDHSRADRSISVLNLLEDVARTNDLVSKAVLYVGFDNSIYASDSLDISLSGDDGLSRMLSSYIHTKPSMERNNLCLQDGTAYILQDIPVNGRKRLGTVILQVDKEKLYRQIKDMEDGSYIVALDEEGDVFLADEDVSDQIAASLRSDGEEDPKRTASYTSALSGLTFYNWKAEKAGFAETVARYSQLMLIAALLAMFGAAYSVLATRAAYRPIRKLIEAVSPETPALMESGLRESELEYLKNLFDRTKADRDSLIATTAVLIPEVERRLLTDIAEDPGSADRVRESLRDINSYFAQKSLIGVMALEISGPDAPETVVEGILPEWRMETCQIRLLTVEEKPWILLFRTDSTMSVDVLREQMKEFLINLKEALGRSSFLRAGIGSFCSTLEQIRGSYLDACQVMTAEVHNVKLPETSLASSQQVRSHLSKCTSLVLKRRPQDAAEEVERYCTSLPLDLVSEEERRQAAAAYGREISRLFSVYGLEGVILPQGLASGTYDVIVNQMTTYGREYVDALDEYCRKKSSRQVVYAKLYITEHYEDGMLSLGEIAEKTGIKPTYLSTLFASVSGERFSDFLKKYRVSMAEEYLKESEAPIKEIAVQCGFNSVQSFNRVFKQVTGQAPGEYRAESLGNRNNAQ